MAYGLSREAITHDYPSFAPSSAMAVVLIEDSGDEEVYEEAMIVNSPSGVGDPQTLHTRDHAQNHEDAQFTQPTGQAGPVDMSLTILQGTHCSFACTDGAGISQGENQKANLCTGDGAVGSCDSDEVCLY